MINWMLRDFDVFGLHGQNWMLALAGAVVVYSVVMALVSIRRGHAPHKHIRFP